MANTANRTKSSAAPACVPHLIDWPHLETRPTHDEGMLARLPTVRLGGNSCVYSFSTTGCSCDPLPLRMVP
jgi:hypothetical protein